MNAIDTNILVYAHRRESRYHQAAFEVVRECAEGALPWAIPWPCVYEFFSVVTNHRIWKEAATTPSQAWRQIEAWTNSPVVRVLAETDGSLDVASQLLQRPRVRGPIVHDARIVAICLVHGVEQLLTKDRDFTLFPELPTFDPIAQ